MKTAIIIISILIFMVWIDVGRLWILRMICPDDSNPKRITRIAAVLNFLGLPGRAIQIALVTIFIWSRQTLVEIFRDPDEKENIPPSGAPATNSGGTQQ